MWNETRVRVPPAQEEWRGVVEQISWAPRAFLFKKFLSDDECDHLINHVSPLRQRPALRPLRGAIQKLLTQGAPSLSPAVFAVQIKSI